MIQPSQTDTEIAAKSLEHLRRAVAIDSASDETSDAIPSTPGQAALAADLEAFFSALGARVERDDYANLIALLPGRGALADAAPLARSIGAPLRTSTVTQSSPRSSVVPSVPVP